MKGQLVILDSCILNNFHILHINKKFVEAIMRFKKFTTIIPAIKFGAQEFSFSYRQSVIIEVSCVVRRLLSWMIVPGLPVCLPGMVRRSSNCKYLMTKLWRYVHLTCPKLKGLTNKIQQISSKFASCS